MRPYTAEFSESVRAKLHDNLREKAVRMVHRSPKSTHSVLSYACELVGLPLPSGTGQGMLPSARVNSGHDFSFTPALATLLRIEPDMFQLWIVLETLRSVLCESEGQPSTSAETAQVLLTGTLTHHVTKKSPRSLYCAEF